MRARRTTLLIALLLLLSASAPAAALAARARFDARVLAHVPSPGFAALSLVAPDGTIYAGSFTNPAGDSLPSKVFAFAPDGTLKHSYTIAGQDLSKVHGVQVAAVDASGSLYLMDQNPARVLVLDPISGRQRTYATFTHLPACGSNANNPECKDTLLDNEPEPDYAAWGPDGSLYVTDYQQALIWRVPPGGGAARVWLTDPRLDGALFGPAGIVLLPDHRTLMLDTAASAPSTGASFAQGKLYTLPIQPDGSPGELRQLWQSGLAEAPDGFALAASGNVYMALVGPTANQLVEISPSGQELARTPPDPITNLAMAVPFDNPSSVQFDGDRLIVTNLSYFLGLSAHQVLFDVFAGEPGAPVFHPPATGPGGGAAQPPAPRLSLSVSPRRIRAGRRTRVRVQVSAAASRRPVAGALVRLARRRARTGRGGNVSFLVTPHHAGVLRVSASAASFASAHARVLVLVRVR